MKARDLIKTGEKAIAIFTGGGRFTLRQDGSGSTGNWVIKKTAKVDKIIIYRKDYKNNQNEIFVGIPIEIRESSQEGRREIKMVNIAFVGTTDKKWSDFIEAKEGARNPIKYIKEKREN
jgi:hypothetical protein